MWPVALAMAALGAAKYAGDRKQYEKDQVKNAAIAQYSPWTGMQANLNQAKPNLFGDVTQGFAGGLGMGQAMDQANNQQALQGQQGKLYDAQTQYYQALAQNPQAGGPVGGSAGAYGSNPGLNAPMGPYQNPGMYK